MTLTLSGFLWITVMHLSLGYVLGRARPWHSLNDAAWWRGISALRKPSRHSTAWALLWLAMNPGTWPRAVGGVRRQRAARKAAR